jgi:hypothetical protein
LGKAWLRFCPFPAHHRTAFVQQSLNFLACPHAEEEEEENNEKEEEEEE